jgi:hypothetical protein
VQAQTAAIAPDVEALTKEIIMKRSAFAAMAVMLSASAALAAPYGNKWKDGPPRWNSPHNVTAYERAAIAQARANLAFVKARSWRDGRLTALERYQIRLAEVRLQRTIFRARHG